jgi:hypothetical protein
VEDGSTTSRSSTPRPQEKGCCWLCYSEKRLSRSLYFCSGSFSICLSTYVVFCRSVTLCVCVVLCVSLILSMYLYQPLCVSMYASLSLYFCLPVCLSFSVWVSLSVCVLMCLCYFLHTVPGQMSLALTSHADLKQKVWMHLDASYSSHYESIPTARLFEPTSTQVGTQLFYLKNLHNLCSVFVGLENFIN